MRGVLRDPIPTPFRRVRADRRNSPMPTLEELVESGDIERLNEQLNDMNTVEIADELARLDRDQRAVPFRLLAKDRALEVFEALDPADEQALLDSLRDERVVQLFEDMDPDDRARLVDEMPATIASRLLAGLSPWERALTNTLLGYPEDTAGRIMSPEFVSLKDGMSAEQALEKVRRAGSSAETVYALPVTDDQRRLIGVVGLRDVVLAEPDQRIGDLMETEAEVYSARVDDDRETVARLIGEADVLALPIVDTENRLVGIVTVDDAIAVLEEEETEDIARTSGYEPVRRPYFSVSVFRLARTRIVWLLLLIVAASLTVSVLDFFQVALETVVTLSLFIPLLIGTGGNTGSQSATTVVRALAVGEVRFEDLPRVVLREAKVGLMLGLGLGLVAFVPVSLLFGTPMGTIVSLSIVTICTFASTVGSLLPILAGRLGFDPAVLSAPFITTIVDATGLVIYFTIAKVILGV
jgi:magnesium transporter